MISKNKSLEKQRENQNRWNREIREAANDIGELPPIAKPERREQGRYDFIFWCNEYLPHHFFRAWTDSQIFIAKNIERVLLRGGYQAIAHKRGGGKTTLSEAGLLWSAYYGHHLYSFFIGSEGGSAEEAHRFFEVELKENDILLEDFPEVGIPIRNLGISGKRTPTYFGAPCEAYLSGHDEIILPTMRKCDGEGKVLIDKNGREVHWQSSGAMIAFKSIFSHGLRGRKYSIAGRGPVRPSAALVDDPQNDGSAKSKIQIDDMENILRKTLPKMAGYDIETKEKKPPSILLAVTCIQSGDLAMRFTDKDLNPDYNGIRFGRFKSMPKNMEHWEQYRDLWRKDGGTRAKPCMERLATRFYLENRTVMDEGAEVDDDSDYETYFQMSAIQCGMDNWCENERSFWCEDQNDPEKAAEVGTGELTPTYIMDNKLVRFGKSRHKLSYRRWIPENTALLTGFIDVGDRYLNYCSTAYGDAFSFAHVVDFGYWPDQKGWHRIRKDHYNVDLQKHYRNGSVAEKICWAIRDCLVHMFSAIYFDHEGNPLDIHAAIPLEIGRDKQSGKLLSVVGVDARDHDHEEAVWSAIAMFNELSTDEFPVRNRVIPWYGEQTRTQHMRNYDNLGPSEWQRGRDRFRVGDGDWIEFPKSKSDMIEKYHDSVHSCLMAEANTYRTMGDTAWKTKIGERGCMTIFDDLPEIILPYAEQQCAMTPKEASLFGTAYKAWEMRKPSIYDKEFFDCNRNCFGLASYAGLNPDYGVKQVEPVRKPRKGSWLDKYAAK